jgi:ATP-dependent NAD(P)H-hydrate dehydratase
MAAAAAPDAAALRTLIPALGDDLYKGQAGKVGVLGGCREYTGAPYFAAMSALRVGADLAHVFCTRSAAPVIKVRAGVASGRRAHAATPPVTTRNHGYGAPSLAAARLRRQRQRLLGCRGLTVRLPCWVVPPPRASLHAAADAADAAARTQSYSPELIVHPYLRDSEELSAEPAGAQADALQRDAVREVCDWLPRLDALVVGPGLGRDEAVLSSAEAVVRTALERGLPLVLDGDGLFLVQRNPSLLQRRSADGAAARVVLTPNVNEFRRLRDALGIAAGADDGAVLQQMSGALGGATLVQKGHADLIAGAAGHVLRCTAEGAPRRCGGQGDVLAGTTAVFVAWAVAAARRANTAASSSEADLQLAAYAACVTTRAAAASAFRVRKRSMVAGDLIAELGAAVEALSPSTPS